jgi:hypothetical protein
VMSSDHTDRDRRSYAYCIQNINGCEPIREAAQYHIVLISQHCNFMISYLSTLCNLEF